MTNRKEHIKKPISLKDLPGKKIYTVSDDYFDKLPTRIQERIIETKKQTAPSQVINWSLRLALPVLALVIMVVYFANRYQNNELDIQALLDEIPTETLITYLDESDLSTDELLSLIDVEELDIDGLMADDVQLFNDDELDVILDEFPEFENEMK